MHVYVYILKAGEQTCCVCSGECQQDRLKQIHTDYNIHTTHVQVMLTQHDRPNFISHGTPNLYILIILCEAVCECLHMCCPSHISQVMRKTIVSIVLPKGRELDRTHLSPTHPLSNATYHSRVTQHVLYTHSTLSLTLQYRADAMPAIPCTL